MAVEGGDSDVEVACDRRAAFQDLALHMVFQRRKTGHNRLPIVHPRGLAGRDDCRALGAAEDRDGQELGSQAHIWYAQALRQRVGIEVISLALSQEDVVKGEVEGWLLDNGNKERGKCRAESIDHMRCGLLHLAKPSHQPKSGNRIASHE